MRHLPLAGRPPFIYMHLSPFPHPSVFLAPALDELGSALENNVIGCG